MKGISALFEKGKTNLVIGGSGSGKTVTLKSMVGLIAPDSGEILFDGRNMVGQKDNAKKKSFHVFGVKKPLKN